LPVALEIAQAIAAIAAVFVGGAWVYFNTLRGRTYKPRLQVTLVAARRRAAQHTLLHARIEVENKGLSEVRFVAEGTGLELSYSPAFLDHSGPTSLRFRERTVFRILERHETIEPGVVISEERVVALPDGPTAICELRLVVVARNNLFHFGRNMSWSCTAVVSEIGARDGEAAEDPRAGGER
jgi:hypothetical protein